MVAGGLTFIGLPGTNSCEGHPFLNEPCRLASLSVEEQFMYSESLLDSELSHPKPFAALTGQAGKALLLTC